MYLAEDKQTTIRVRRKSSNCKATHRWLHFPFGRPEQSASDLSWTHIQTILEKYAAYPDKKLLENTEYYQTKIHKLKAGTERETENKMSHTVHSWFIIHLQKINC